MTAQEKDTQALKRTIAIAGATVAAGSIERMAHAAGSGKIKIGLLGCGGRGNGALRQSLNADPGIELVAMADLFESKVKSSRARIEKDEKCSAFAWDSSYSHLCAFLRKQEQKCRQAHTDY